MKQEKQFGIWMDTHHATIVASNETLETGLPVILAHINGEPAGSNTNEKHEHHQATTLQTKFFKEITSHLQNATKVHVSGTGQVQEQFIHYLAATPQFKHTKTEESTSTKMDDQKLLAFFSDKLN